MHNSMHTGTKKPRKAISEINVVPYIDVMLVLLVVFMVTAPLLTQGLAIELPKVSADPLPQMDEPLVVSIKADGGYYLSVNSKPEPIALLEVQDRVSKILSKKPNLPVLVEGDARVSYGKVVELMAALQNSGAQKVGLMTDIPVNTRK